MNYIKKPLIVEAITFDELVEHGARYYAGRGIPMNNGTPWSFEYQGHPITHETDDCYLVPTPEGTMKFNRGDMLVTGIEGEIYPVKASVFAETYRPTADCEYQAHGKEVMRETATNIEHVADASTEENAALIVAALNRAKTLADFQALQVDLDEAIEDLNKPQPERPTFAQELVSLINRHSIENISNTPDWILCDYILGCLRAYDMAIHYREEYHGRPGTIGVTHKPVELEETPPIPADHDAALARSLLYEAARAFRFYQQQHTAKLKDSTLTEPSRAAATNKATVNAGYAQRIEQFLGIDPAIPQDDAT